METPRLETFLHATYPRLLPNWDGKPLIYMSYDHPSGGGGTLNLGKLNGDVREISEGLVKELKEIWLPEGTNIRIRNGGQSHVSIEPGEVVAPPLTGRLDDSKYQEILAYLRKEHPQIYFETAS